ncbi:receptor like protein 22 [Cryptomeria japonica]|uniref:receptor like protein 22 n=1 Tax=Cryptomeria japonica TaxID=3369 RepID=UPI0027D9D7A8|nr:receptor like protein 22 [Cryptomeria japonica]
MESSFPYGRVAFAIMTISLCCICFTSSPAIACSLHERNHLLDFKAAVIDEDKMLSSWHGFNCCTWSGVSCDFSTGHVSLLDLSGYNLQGNIGSSLFQLAQLEHLDLSYNLFHGNFTPHIGKLKRLSFLDLSVHFGELSLSLESLSNLVSLEYLSLSGVEISVTKEGAEALGGLSKLQLLHMSRCRLKGPIPNFLVNLTSLLHLSLFSSCLSAQIRAWLEDMTAHLLSLDLSWNENLKVDVSSAIWNMSSLEHLDLSGTRIEGEIPPAIGNMLSLQSLHLSETRIAGEIPSTIGNLLSLQSLDLSNTSIEGEIPVSIFNLSKLVLFDLSHNMLTGLMPPSLGSLSSLVYLDLSYNQLNGTFPLTVSHLVRLEYLWLNSNNFSGSISLSLFHNLTRLQNLSLSNNHLIVSTDSTWIPQFKKLVFLNLRSCNLDRIPSFLVTQYDLGYLDLSANNIAANIPSWIWDLPSLFHLNLSSNQLSGSLPSRLASRTLWYLDLHNNSLEGDLPVPPAGIRLLHMSMNQFNGSIPIDIGQHLQYTHFLSLSSNNLSGPIPNSICTPDLKVLELSNNMLSGIIPPHLTRNCSFLSVLDFAENHLEGKMPAEWGNLEELHTLKLNTNHLTGIIPSSISKCRSLQVLDVANNNLEGSIPHQIAMLPQLHVLMLRSNQLQGGIPPQVIDLPNLQILDLSGNKLSGSIPSNLTNLLAMVDASQSNASHLEEDLVFGRYTNQITMTWKGLDVEFTQVLFILKCIDLSNNYFSGSIPPRMGSLKGLIALNLSRNHLSGQIPRTLGGMDQLESLDLSLNRLNGKIPLELQSLSYLQILNLSYNMIDGKVPHGGQFLTFGESSYLGSPKLSGIPFTNITVCNNSSGYVNCTNVETIGEAENSDADMIEWAVQLGLSYGLGFSIVFGLLAFNKRVRKSIFNLYDVIILGVDRCIRGERWKYIP